MTEGLRHSEETPPQGPGVSEQVMTRPALATDQEIADQSPPRPGTRPAGAGRRPSGLSARSVFKRPLLLTGAAAVCLVAGLMGFRYYRHLVTHEWTDDAFVEGHVIQISPKVAGHVSQVYVTDKQEVRRGAILLEIDPSDYTVRLAQARAVLEAALARQQAAQSSVALMQVTSTAGIQQATAGVELARSVVQTARA